MMLVDINLLPKKAARNLATVLIVSIALLFLTISAIYLFWNITTMKQASQQLDNEIEVSNELLAIEQKKLADYQSTNEVEQLEKAIKWTEQQPVNVNFIIQELTKLLPKRGFILDFSFSGSNVQCTVQFDTSADAAYYLHALLITDWLKDATLTSRKAEKLAELDDADDYPEQLDKQEKTILPRYVADYDLTIDISVLKAHNQKAGGKKGKIADGGGDLS